MTFFTRPTSPALDEILGQKFPVLDHGFVRVVDYMGNDGAIVQAARVSYGGGTKTPQEDANLIRYLMRNRHTSVFEACEIKLHVKLPIFVARQWIRHRTACLTGDMPLTFDLPAAAGAGRAKRYYLTVKEVFDRFQPTENKQRPDKQRNNYFKRDRVKRMRLRSCDETHETVYHTRIVDVWENGVKPVLEVVFENGSVLKATKDHLCFTDRGWLRLEDALACNAEFASTGKSGGYESNSPVLKESELSSEQWRAVVGMEDKYEVSSLGRVRTLINTRNTQLELPRLKRQTVSDAGYAVVSLSNRGVSRVRFVHHLVLEAFGTVAREGRQACHIDHNRQNNRVTNLTWGDAATNSRARMEDGCDQRLTVVYVAVSSWRNAGEEMTYDIEVDGPYHNFQCGGVFVHNSVNEVSGRYSLLPEEYYVPEEENILPQSNTNKQGREEGAKIMTSNSEVRELMDRGGTKAFELYNAFLEIGIARELSRIVLPVSTYTEWYWKIDLHNLFHFLKLRMDSHAQWEIRQYAEEIFKLVKLWVPVAAQAWLDYQYNSVTLSAAQIKLIAAKLAGEPSEPSTFKLSIREVQELEEALKRDE